MNGYQHSHQGGSRISFALLAVVGALAAATAFTLVSLSHERAHSAELIAARDRLGAALFSTQKQVQTLQHELDDVHAEQALPQAPQEPAIPPPAPRSRHAVVHPPALPPQTGDADRLQEVEDRLDSQGKQIAVTRDAMDKTRNDLQDKIAATDAELKGSITQTHEQVAQLQKTEEPTYYPFTLSPSREFQTVGPVQVGLRKVNARHGYYDLSLMLEDRQLDKKHVNLDEPVWITLSGRRQPAELVVTRIDKDQVQGYVRAPQADAVGTQAADPAPATPAPTSPAHRRWLSFLPHSLHRQ
jgi:hypothetical protein